MRKNFHIFTSLILILMAILVSTKPWSRNKLPEIQGQCRLKKSSAGTVLECKKGRRKAHQLSQKHRYSLGYPMNIEKATVEELQILPLIGPRRALSIRDYRNTNGKIGRIEDLTDIKGIGPKTLETLREHISLETSPERKTNDDSEEIFLPIDPN